MTGRFQMIAGVHDLSETPDAQGDELKSWVAFSQARPLLDRILENTRQIDATLHLTSDDGFRSDYTLLTPWLLDNSVSATFFIATRYIDRPGRLTVAQLREIAGFGFRIGVHGARHINWAKAGKAAFLEDLHEGRDRLQQWLGSAVDIAAPPFGGYTGPVIRRLFAEGFREIHTSRDGLALTAVPLKPRNMLKPGNLDAVLATSEKNGSLEDALRCHIRLLRARLPGMRA